MEVPFMDYPPIFSLKQRAVLSVTIELWKHADIRKEAPSEWDTMERKVFENANQLSLPHNIKKEILPTVKLIGLQIVDWMILIEYSKYCRDYVKYSRYSSTDFINHFCWTSQGTIDEQKTITLFLNNQSLAIEYRYKLACIFCCEIYVSILRNQLPDKYKEKFGISTKHGFHEKKRLFDFWTCHVNEDTTRLISVISQEAPNDGLFKHMLKWSIRHNNHVATLYFWQKLTNIEKNDAVVDLVALAVRYRRTNILWLFLSQMDNVQRGHVFEKYPYEVLGLIYESYRYQGFFLSMANCMWRFISPSCFFYLLLTIIKEKSQKMLKEFWIQSPDHLKKFIVTRHIVWDLLSKLLKAEDVASIKLILNSANADEKKLIALTEKFVVECRDLIRRDKWVLLKVFLEITFESDEEINDFKSTLAASSGTWLSSRAEQWQLVEEFLNWRCSSEDKIKELKRKITQSSGDDMILPIIRVKKWGLVDKYLNWRFCALEEISDFKKRLLRTDGKDFCDSLMRENNWELVEEFLSWCESSSSEEILNFKHELARSRGIALCRIFLKESNWESVERFLVWCCFSSAQEISNFKKDIGTHEGYNICMHYAQRRKVQSADKFLNWCFSSREEINNFKRELLRSRGIEMVYEFMFYDFQPIDEFLNWGFSSQEEINQFKREIISSSQKICVCVSLMHENMFESAENFLNWCSLSELEVHEFKRELLFSDENVEFFEECIDGEVFDRNKRMLWIDDEWGLANKLINWYSQPKEVIDEFKSIEFTRSKYSQNTESEFNARLTYFFDTYFGSDENRLLVEENPEEEEEEETVNT